MQKQLKRERGPVVRNPRKIPNDVRALFPDNASVFIEDGHWVGEWWEVEGQQVVAHQEPVETTKPLTASEVEEVTLGSLAKASQVRELASRLTDAEMHNTVLEENVKTYANRQSNTANKVQQMSDRQDELEMHLAKVKGSERDVADLRLAMEELQSEIAKVQGAHKITEQYDTVADKVNAVVVNMKTQEENTMALQREYQKLDKSVYELTGHLASLADAVFHIGNNKDKKKYAGEAFELTKLRPDLFEGDK